MLPPPPLRAAGARLPWHDEQSHLLMHPANATQLYQSPLHSCCRGQGYHGLMDEVRLWRVARSQADILAHMRDSTGLDSHQVRGGCPGLLSTGHASVGAHRLELFCVAVGPYRPGLPTAQPTPALHRGHSSAAAAAGSTAETTVPPAAGPCRLLEVQRPRAERHLPRNAGCQGLERARQRPAPRHAAHRTQGDD